MLLNADRGLGDAEVQRKLAALRRAPYNYDASRGAERTASNGWRSDDFCQPLPSELPGPPEPEASWEVARRLMWGYEFADPSIVRAFYDPDEPLHGRTMLLELRFHGLVRVDAGTRVAEVYDEQREVDGRPAHVWGWAYRTLRGHVEQGQMDWQVWKWADTGEVEFRIHAYSKRAADPNPIVRLGFALFGRREQLAFLRSTLRRMRALTEAAVTADGGDVRAEAERLTARPGVDTGRAHDELVRRVRDRPQ